MAPKKIAIVQRTQVNYHTFFFVVCALKDYVDRYPDIKFDITFMVTLDTHFFNWYYVIGQVLGLDVRSVNVVDISTLNRNIVRNQPLYDLVVMPYADEPSFSVVQHIAPFVVLMHQNVMTQTKVTSDASFVHVYIPQSKLVDTSIDTTNENVIVWIPHGNIPVDPDVRWPIQPCPSGASCPSRGILQILVPDLMDPDAIDFSAIRAMQDIPYVQLTMITIDSAKGSIAGVQPRNFVTDTDTGMTANYVHNPTPYKYNELVQRCDAVFYVTREHSLKLLPSVGFAISHGKPIIIEKSQAVVLSLSDDQVHAYNPDNTIRQRFEEILTALNDKIVTKSTTELDHVFGSILGIPGPNQAAEQCEG